MLVKTMLRFTKKRAGFNHLSVTVQNIFEDNAVTILTTFSNVLQGLQLEKLLIQTGMFLSTCVNTTPEFNIKRRKLSFVSKNIIQIAALIYISA